MDSLFEINMALCCQVKALEEKIEEFESGKRYLKIQKDYSRIVDGYIKAIKKLRAELASAHAHADTIHVREIWTEQSYEQWEEHKQEINCPDKGEKDKARFPSLQMQRLRHGIPVCHPAGTER